MDESIMLPLLLATRDEAMLLLGICIICWDFHHLLGELSLTIFCTSSKPKEPKVSLVPPDISKNLNMCYQSCMAFVLNFNTRFTSRSWMFHMPMEQLDLCLVCLSRAVQNSWSICSSLLFLRFSRKFHPQVLLIFCSAKKVLNKNNGNFGRPSNT